MNQVIQDIESQISRLRLDGASKWRKCEDIQEYKARMQDLHSQLARALEIQRNLDSQK